MARNQVTVDIKLLSLPLLILSYITLLPGSGVVTILKNACLVELRHDNPYICMDVHLAVCMQCWYNDVR